MVSKWAHAARYISQAVPTTEKAGSTFTVTVKMRNVGTKTRNSAEPSMLRNARASFGTTTATCPARTGSRRGQDKTFTFTCKAPATPGNYTMKWRMYRASTYNQFFGDTSKAKTISVVP
jgi:hypothetical protein